MIDLIMVLGIRCDGVGAPSPRGASDDWPGCWQGGLGPGPLVPPRQCVRRPQEILHWRRR